MSAKELLSFSNIMFIVAAIYFLVVSALGEGSFYSTSGTVLCILAVVLVIRKDMYFTAPWRVATSSFTAAMFVSQVIANSYAGGFSSYLIATSTVVNGILFVLFLGVLLLTAKEMTKQKKEDKPKQEKKSAQKITYEI